MNRDLYLAVLSLDAYNRGYSPGVLIDGGNNSRSIGDASFVSASADIGESFYAVAYDMTGATGFSSGETVISHRGTDDFAGDVYSWAGGIGFQTAQAGLAADFYRTVSDDDIYGFDVTFTGHSLGGGLSGLLAGLYGKEAVVFDNMPHEASANSTYFSTQETMPDIYTGLPIPNPGYDPDVIDQYYGTETPQPVDFSGISAYQVDGQAIQATIAGQSAPLVTLDPGDTDLDLIDLHSMSFLTILLYADQTDGANPDWYEIREPLLEGLFDEEIAQAAGMDPADTNGTDTEAGKMRTMIAYSVIDEGTRPFGDVAIRAMFDDANQLVSTLEANSGDCEGFDGQFGALSVDSIVSMLVQNAGQVASRAVLASSSPGGADPLDGIILDSADANAVAMSIDTFSPVWERQDSDPTEIIGYAPLKATIVSGLSGLSNDALDHVTSVLDDARGIVIANVQDRVVDAAVAMGELAPEYHLDDAETAGAIVYGSLGTDAIFGTDNADVLLGGAGDDILFSGNAADVLIGGLGSDSFVFTSLDSEEIILQGNNEDDRLYISAELLGFDVETGIDFFPLLGGMISDVEEPDMDEDEGANYVFTQTKYTAVSEWETTPTRVFSDIGQDIVYNLEYDLFTDHLEIIYTAWGEEEMIGQLMIRIDNFEVGDYGIQLYDEPFDFTTETGIDEEVLEDHNAMVDYLTSNGDLLTFTTGTGGTWEVV